MEKYLIKKKKILEEGEEQQEEEEDKDKEEEKERKESKIKDKKKKNYIEKERIYQIKNKEIHSLRSELPKIFSNIIILEFGEIKNFKSFIKRNKIYPVGYKCEIIIKNNNHIIIEIVDMDNQPEFLITFKSSGRVEMVSSEIDIFKKVINY